jgi:uncharacterized protein involved in exopolysaccharide biosynthesis
MENYLLQHDRSNSGLREFLNVIFKYKTMITYIILAVVLAVTAATFLIVPVYKAESSFMVKIGREYLNRPEVGNNAPIMALSQEEVTNSEIQILTNRDLIEKVITEMGVVNIYPELVKDPPDPALSMEKAVTLFLGKLDVQTVKKSNVVQISFEHSNPQIAAQALNLLVTSFKEKHLQVFSDPKSSFLEKQLAEYGQKLKESEDSLETFKQKAGIFSLEEQRTLLLGQRNVLDSSLKQSQDAVYEMAKRIATLKVHKKELTANGALYTSSDRDRIIVEAKAKLLSLQMSEQELSRKYTDNNRLVVNVRKEIQMVKDFLNEQEKELNNKVKTGNQIYQTAQIDLIRAETELNAQRGKAVALKKQLAEVDGRLHALEASDKNVQKLKRDLTINEKNFQT